MESIKINSVHNVDFNYKVCNIADRLLAVLLDVFVILIITLGLIYLFIKLDLFDRWIRMVVFGSPFLLYNFLFEVFLEGKSVGKVWRKIKVISVSGDSASIGQYFIRFLLRPIDFLLGLGVIFVVFSDKGQRIGDLLAGTTVVKLEKELSLTDIASTSDFENYKPIFKSDISYQLSDKEVSVIRKVLITRKATPNHKNVIALAKKIQNKISNPALLSEYKYLKILLNDYEYFSNKL